MGVIVTFNGISLNNLLEITEGFTPFDGADFSPVVLDKEGDTGARYVTTDIGSKSIQMPFIIQRNVKEKYNRLMQTLNVKEPKKLTFSSLPNVEFMAIPNGTLGFKETFLQGEGVINWLIPDGVGVSPIKTRVPFVEVEPGLLEATVVNNGSDWATVDYNVTMNHENGYVGIISQYGAIQLGNPEEADAVPAEKSVLITNNPGGNFANWTDGTVNYENKSKTVETTMTSANDLGGRLGILPTNGFTNSKNGSHFGALKEFSWTTPSINWYIWSKARFETGLMGQTGSWCLSVISDSNEFIAGMAIEKNDATGNNARIYFLVNKHDGLGSTIVKTIDFTPSYWIPPNPYGDQSRMANRNMFDIRKEGKRITFFYYGRYYPFDIPALEKVNANRVQFFVGQFRGRATDTRKNSRIVTRMYLSQFSMYANKVPYMKDVPNKYPKDSIIFIDGVNKKPYYNNMLRLGDEVLGSTYFKVPPGETKIQIAYSSFSDPAPSAYAVVNEVFL